MDKEIIKALRNGAQSASNAVAQNVSVPVDAITWALRKAGMEIPTPVMGSEWMQEKGLTAPTEPGIASAIGESAGTVIPIVGFGKYAKIAK